MFHDIDLYRGTGLTEEQIQQFRDYVDKINQKDCIY
jgi:hypothetical protein